MKRLLLLSVAIALWLCSPASADIPVIDPTSVANQIKEFAQQLKSYATQLQQQLTGLQQLEQQIQQVTWLANTFEALAHNPNLGAVLGLMNQLGIQDPLPINPQAALSMIQGGGGMGGLGALTGRLSSLNGLITTNYGQNQVFNCTDESFACKESQARATSLASSMGISGQIYGSLADHFQVLQGLRDRLETANTPKDVQDAAAQLAAEQAWTANATGQLQATLGMAQMQAQIRTQRASEQLDQHIQEVIKGAPAG